MKYVKKLPCGAVFRTPVIRKDGSVTVCNYDLGLEFKLGNVNQDNLFELWEGDKINELRLAHITGENLPEKCKKCKPDYFLESDKAINYLKKIKREELVLPFIVKNSGRPKVLLVNPLVSPKAPFKTCVTLGLGSIATYIGPYFDVEIINMNHSNIDNYTLVNYMKKNDFNVIGVTAMTYQIKGAYKLLKLVKENIPDCISVMGGVFASMSPDIVMKNSKDVDFIIKGEGEQAFLEFLENISEKRTDFENWSSLVYRQGGEIVKNENIEFLPADKIPLIDRKRMPTLGFIYDDTAFSDEGKREVSAVVMFSRGCPSNCIFCESPGMWKRKVRLMSIPRIIKEIKFIIAEYGITNFVIDDDAFTVFRENIIQFCKEIINQKIKIKFRINTKVNLVDRELFRILKEAGCVKVTYGVESGDPVVLKNLNKRFTIQDVKNALKMNQEENLPASMLMIIGSPGETPETIENSLDLINQLNPVGGYDFQIMQPHPGTILREEIHRFGGSVLTDDWDEYYSDNITYIPDGFDEKEFLKYCKKITRRPISIAGKDNVSFSKLSGDIINIPVDMWDFAQFDRLEAFYWKGEERFQKGYTHVLGSDYGFIKYNFDMTNTDFKRLELLFTACSQNIEKKSFVKIFLNEIKIAELFIGKKDSVGFDYSVDVSGETLEKTDIKEGINSIKFVIENHDEYANGISLMYRALENAYEIQEKPIRLVLKS